MTSAHSIISVSCLEIRGYNSMAGLKDAGLDEHKMRVKNKPSKNRRIDLPHMSYQQLAVS
jgi:hypothetical protein